jgi:hypothetical protein
VLPTPAPSLSQSPPEFDPLFSVELFTRPGTPAEAGEQSDLSRYDGELLMHWIEVVAATMALDNRLDKTVLWRDLAPLMAQSNDFLMHELLSLSACHISCTDPDPARQIEYLAIGRRHHDEASLLFRAPTPISPCATKPATPPVFCPMLEPGLQSLSMNGEDQEMDGSEHSAPSPPCSTTGPFNIESRPLYIGMTVQAGLFLLQPTGNKSTDLAAFVDWLIFLRYSLQFGWATYSPRLGPDTPLAGFLAHLRDGLGGPPALLDPDPGMVLSLDGLERANRQGGGEKSGLGPVDIEHMSMAIQSTKLWARLVPLRPRSYIYSMTWILTMANDYFRLLKAGNYMALAVLCHFLLPLMNAPRKWFFKDWFERAIGAVLEVLGDDWAEELAWVSEQYHDDGLGGVDLD